MLSWAELAPLTHLVPVPPPPTHHYFTTPSLSPSSPMLSHDARNLPLLAAALLFSSRIGSVQAAYCVQTGRGFEECSLLSPGARIGIGIAIALLGLLVIMTVAILRQRRIKRNNLAYVTNNIGLHGAPPGYYQPQVPYPQYPAPAHSAYDPRGGFAPPYQPQSPPQYTPPPGPPPPTVADKV